MVQTHVDEAWSMQLGEGSNMGRAVTWTMGWIYLLAEGRTNDYMIATDVTGMWVWHELEVHFVQFKNYLQTELTPE